MSSKLPLNSSSCFSLSPSVVSSSEQLPHVSVMPPLLPSLPRRWSCDEGASWNTTSFVNTRILVVGMLTERGEKARHVTYVSRVHKERELS